MRLLIVEDNQSLAEVTLLALRKIDDRHIRVGGGALIEAISIAGDLESAIERIAAGRIDVILCDGEFPVSKLEPTPKENWAIVATHARRAEIGCIVYSGSLESVWAAKDAGLAALAKPAPVERIYAALTAQCAVVNSEC